MKRSETEAFNLMVIDDSLRSLSFSAIQPILSFIATWEKDEKFFNVKEYEKEISELIKLTYKITDNYSDQSRQFFGDIEKEVLEDLLNLASGARVVLTEEGEAKFQEMIQITEIVTNGLLPIYENMAKLVNVDDEVILQQGTPSTVH